jgi:uncharacterized glyoxalase superfamily protein PhnB
MSLSNAISSSVEINVDPGTAFKVFTEELNCWWLQGAINFHDSSRAYEKRMEPGIGGRILEVYDLETGEGLELGRITGWEPGERLAWSSSIDDVATGVRFEPIDPGTRVTVTARIPENGADRGGTAWIRMTPVWLGGWIEKRDRVPHEPKRMARLAIAIHYADPARAARWLRDVFDFTPAGNIPDQAAGDLTWIEFHIGNASVILFNASDTAREEAVTHTPWVFVDDLDQQYVRARDGGARILQEIQQHGARTFQAADLEGYRWTFAQAAPRM